jgi:hypothetical protein
LLNTNAMVAICRTDELSDTLKCHMDTWQTEYDSYKRTRDEATQNGEPPPVNPMGTSALPYKKCFAFTSVVTVLAQYLEGVINDDALMDGTAEKPLIEAHKRIISSAVAAAQELAAYPTDKINSYVGTCEATYKTPLAGKPWKFDVMLTPFASVTFKECVITVIEASDIAKGTILQPRRQFSTEGEQELWDHLKRQPKRKPRPTAGKGKGKGKQSNR